jgi:hypothetical protein
MSGVACSLLIAALSSAVVEAAAGVDTEVAAGRAPIDVEGPEENSVTFTLVPGAAVRLRDSDSTLSLGYAPRIFYRLPNSIGLERPLVLHQLTLDHAAEVSRKLAWTNTAQLSAGQLDYTAAGLVFDPGVPTGVPTSVADVLRVEGQTSLTYQLSRRVNLLWLLAADYTTSLDGSETVALSGVQTLVSNPLPESAQVTSEWSLGYALSRTDRVGTAAELTYQWFPDTGRYLLLSPDVYWETQLSRRTTLGASAGFAYVLTLETADPNGDTDPAVGGTGSFQISSIAYRSRGFTLTTRFNASLDWFFDPLAGTSDPRAGVQASSDLEIGRDWLIAPTASFFSVLRDEDAATGVAPGDTPVVTLLRSDATILRAELPVRYSLSKWASLSFGARAALRGGSLSSDNFRLDEQVELWAFVGLTVRLASGHDYGSWLSL